MTGAPEIYPLSKFLVLGRIDCTYTYQFLQKCGRNIQECISFQGIELDIELDGGGFGISSYSVLCSWRIAIVVLLLYKMITEETFSLNYSHMWSVPNLPWLCQHIYYLCALHIDSLTLIITWDRICFVPILRMREQRHPEGKHLALRSHSCEKAEPGFEL